MYKELYNRFLDDKIKIARLQRQFFVNLRACIKQERFSVSNKSNIEIRTAIKEIVNNHVVHNVSEEYLQVIHQGKQKLFVSIVRYKCVELLYFINKIGGL